MSIDSVAEFFLGNKQKVAHQTDVSSLETPQIMPYISTPTQSPDITRTRRNKFAIKAQRNSKAA